MSFCIPKWAMHPPSSGNYLEITARERKKTPAPATAEYPSQSSPSGIWVLTCFYNFLHVWLVSDMLRMWFPFLARLQPFTSLKIAEGHLSSPCGRPHELKRSANYGDDSPHYCGWVRNPAPPKGYKTMVDTLSITGWWFSHPSEKYDSQLGW